MSDLIQAIKDKREDILIGEIGALLHDIGKCHPDFVKKNSVESIGNFDHADIDVFLSPKLVQQIKDKKFKIDFAGNITADVYSLIKEHHKTKNNLVNILESCDRLDSADAKGIIRKKQSIDNTVINSPFGYPKEKIDLKCLQNRLDDLSGNLIGIFKNYISNSISLAYVRESVINNLETTFTHALGETRIPSNDVTLWDHSHSTASLFKSILCSLALGDPQKSQWRILGFCWDGTGFINKGKKVADILKRNEIINDIKKKLKNKFEDEMPIGNAIYEDTNGIYFTFPELENDKSNQLAKECAKIGLEIIRKESGNEIWPFFTLSEASRTLTIISKELKSASDKRKITKISPTLFIECKPEGEILVNNPELPISKNGEDICPVCQFRTKPVNSESCEICEKRRKGRMNSWLSNSVNTIWIDEVADKNNRIALLTLSFDLDKWLDGTMIGTIYSQSFEDWRNSKDANIRFKNNQNIQKLKKKGVKIDDALIDLSKNTLKIITDEDISKDIGFKSDLINTFFEDIRSSQNQNDEYYFKKFVENLKLRLEPEPFNSSNLQRLLFTQNPSPARLYRIWKETEDFFDLIFREIKDNTYSTKRKRIKFSIDISSLNLKYGIEKDTLYLIKIEGLEPENLLVFHSSNGGFCTIESLEKFKLNNKNEIEAIEYGLKNKGFYHLAYENKTDENLLANAQPVKISNIETEEYYPFIEITKSPLSLRLILPALDSIKILELVAKLYNERFRKVIGKLPLNTGLLVSKRKFPLYVLLDAGERMLNDEKFKESEEMDSWWDITELRNDKYYSFYPAKKLSGNDKYYTLDELASLSKGKHFTLYLGYFDFDLFLATTDMYKINYETKKRIDEDYKLLSSRPYYFYQISQMIALWEILYNNISSSQINFIEEMFNRKLIEWRNNPDKEIVFRDFVVATLKDAFAKKWGKLRVETQDFLINSALNRLLLDTIILFRHTIKVKEVNENE